MPFIKIHIDPSQYELLQALETSRRQPIMQCLRGVRL